MLNKLKQICKSSRTFYTMYYHVMSLILRFLGLFIKVKKNQVLFVVYGGQRYDDSPRFIYEYMKGHPQYSKYKCKWAFIDPDSIKEVPKEEKVRIDTPAYYKTALESAYWITNSSASRGLNFMHKKTVNICSEHGMAGMKVIGTDIKEKNGKNKSFVNGFSEKFDAILIEGKKETEILKRAWNANEKMLIQYGLPRNDELVHKTPEDIIALKKKLGVPLDKKVILYAPTFREYKRDSALAVYLKPPFDFDKWYECLGDEYVLLLTAHYEVAKLMDVPKAHPFVINAFKYPHINDLMLVSDLLISDYSSVVFDYSILGRPIISYAYDYEDYRRERGLYDGYEGIFSHGVMRTEEDVIHFIRTMNYDAECKYTRENIRDEYIANYGDATEKCTKAIFEIKK